MVNQPPVAQSSEINPAFVLEQVYRVEDGCSKSKILVLNQYLLESMCSITVFSNPVAQRSMAEQRIGMVFLGRRKDLSNSG